LIQIKASQRIDYGLITFL